MDFEGIEELDKNNDQNILENESVEEKIPETLEAQENVVNQHQDYGFLSKDRVSKERKDLSEKIKEFLKIKKELIINKENNKDKVDRIEELKGEINKLIGKDKEL